VDGVPSQSFSITVDEDSGFRLDVDLTGPLALIEFIPHQVFPARSGDVSYDDALARATAMYPVNAAEISESADYWVFPVFQVGCCGVLVEKASGRSVEFGSYTGLDAWIWGYEQGLLDEQPRDLVVISVRDAAVALRALKQFVARPTIDVLPVTFVGCAGWRAIRPLRESGDAFEWRCEVGASPV
jgi:hypothetical protein